MVESTRLSQGGNNGAQALLDCEELANHAGDGACRDVLLILCRRDAEGLATTIWDIHRETGLALHEAFAGLRTLEFGKVVDIRDDPSDPFGATVILRRSGLEQLHNRSAA